MKDLKIIILYLFSFFSIETCFAGDTTRVFFIGNSFTYVFDAPGLVKGLADAAHKPFYYEQHTPGGVSVGDIAQDTLAHWRNPSVFNTLREGKWDYTVLQDNQGRFIYDYGTFPSTTVSRVIEGHIKINDSMHYYNPCAIMLLFAGWGPQNGYLPYSGTGTGLIDKIFANYTFLNDSMHEVISPIGKAWERAMLAYPAVDLWGPDSTHPSLAGSYMTASVIFCTIFRMNPENINFTGGLDSAVARNFRRIAWQTVADSVAVTNLTSISVPVTLSGDTIKAAGGYVSYQWVMNGTPIAGATNYYILTDSSDCYSVEAVDTNGCLRRSVQHCTGGTTTAVNTLPVQSGIALYPNPARDVFTFEIPCNQAQLTITDYTGRTIAAMELYEMHNIVSTTGFASGLYVVTIQTGEKKVKEKLVVVH